jgi:hypothetical protein
MTKALGIFMLVAPVVYGLYRAHKKGDLIPMLKGAASTVGALLWVAVAVWLANYASK